MEIKGKIIAILPPREGVSKAGKEWKIQEYVLETLEKYPKKMMFSVFGAERIAQFNITEIGEELIVRFDIDATVYNGRWYNSISAWKVEREAVQEPIQAPEVTPTADEIFASKKEEKGTDDLPF